MPADGYNLALALADARHINSNVAGADTEIGASSSKIRHAAAGNHGFRWRAAFIYASAPDVLALDGNGVVSGARKVRCERRVPAWPEPIMIAS